MLSLYCYFKSHYVLYAFFEEIVFSYVCCFIPHSCNMRFCIGMYRICTLMTFIDFVVILTLTIRPYIMQVSHLSFAVGTNIFDFPLSSIAILLLKIWSVFSFIFPFYIVYLVSVTVTFSAVSSSYIPISSIIKFVGFPPISLDLQIFKLTILFMSFWFLDPTCLFVCRLLPLVCQLKISRSFLMYDLLFD